MVGRAVFEEELDEASAIGQFAVGQACTLRWRTSELVCTAVVKGVAIKVGVHKPIDSVEVVRYETDTAIYEHVHERFKLIRNADRVARIAEQIQGHEVPSTL